MAKTPTSETLSFIRKLDELQPVEVPSDLILHQRDTVTVPRRRTAPARSEEPVVFHNIIHEGPTKTRRVNPQNLADRLGPDLVRDMEAFIFPGAKMPPFSIRKELQERYAVDRRHIYDYFHSRGLRVAKEDKHTNLVRGRATKMMSRSCSKSSPDLSHEAPVRTVDNPGRKRRSKSNQKFAILPNYKYEGHQQEDKLSMDPDPQLRFDHSFDLSSQRNFEAGAIESFDLSSHHNVEASAIESQVSSAEESLDIGHTPPADCFYDEYLSEQAMVLDDLQINVKETPSDIDHGCVSESLLRDERVGIYNLINNSIGPTHGIQESVGTYKTYMQERSRLYFDRLLSNSRRTSYTHEATYDDGLTSSPQMQHPLSTQWLLATNDCAGTCGGTDDFPDSSHCGKYNPRKTPLIPKQNSKLNESDAFELGRFILLSPADCLSVERPCGSCTCGSAKPSASCSGLENIIEEKEIETPSIDVGGARANLLFHSNLSVKPKLSNDSATTSARINNKKPVPLPSTTLLNAGRDLRQTTSVDALIDAWCSNEITATYSASNIHSREIRNLSFGAKAARSRTSSAGGGI